MTNLMAKSQLKSLSLVNMHHSPESFDLLIQYVEQSDYLKELDLSWSIIQQPYWVKFLDVIKENRNLVSLTLAFNQILEDQNRGYTLEYRHTDPSFKA